MTRDLPRMPSTKCASCQAYRKARSRSEVGGSVWWACVAAAIVVGATIAVLLGGAYPGFIPRILGLGTSWLLIHCLLAAYKKGVDEKFDQILCTCTRPAPPTNITTPTPQPYNPYNPLNK